MAMIATPLLAPASNVQVYSLAEELVLFAQDTSQLYRLNSTAAFIWSGLAEGLSLDLIVEQLAGACEITRDAALRDVHAAIDHWQTLGLIGNASVTSPVTPPLPSKPANSKALRRHADRPPGARSPLKKAAADHTPSRRRAIKPPQQWAATRRYHLLDTCFQVWFATRAMEDFVHPVLAHLQIMEAAPAERQIEITEQGTRYTVYHDGSPVANCGALDELAPLVNAEILVTAYGASDCLTAVHAAVVSDGHQCLLLPATSGSGKSTLAAALAASGWGYFTDEVALITRGDHLVRPVPVSLSTKSGAWPVLAPLYPRLLELPVHRRQDGRTVRYLPPPASALPRHFDAALPIGCIVFPRYRPETATKLSPLSAADGLCRIAEAGYDVNGRLERDRVAELVAWLRHTPCYELIVGDLRQAVARLTGVLR